MGARHHMAIYPRRTDEHFLIDLHANSHFGLEARFLNHKYTSMNTAKSRVYYRFSLADSIPPDIDLNKINVAIEMAFRQHQHDENIRKTHNFGGRYENVYLDQTHIPELGIIIEGGTRLAEQLLEHQDGYQDECKGLRVGYWFNAMPPGSITTLHRHDDFDELYSAVYYVTAPENSGNLVIHQNGKLIELTPKAGDFIFFKPDLPHEVSRNNSQYERLSIGFNFGPVDSDFHRMPD